MGQMVDLVLDLALRTFRVCSAESKAATQLGFLINGIGYTVNARGDLTAIPVKSFRPLKLSTVFIEDAAYLKGLLT